MYTIQWVCEWGDRFTNALNICNQVIRLISWMAHCLHRKLGNCFSPVESGQGCTLHFLWFLRLCDMFTVFLFMVLCPCTKALGGLQTPCFLTPWALLGIESARFLCCDIGKQQEHCFPSWFFFSQKNLFLGGWENTNTNINQWDMEYLWWTISVMLEWVLRTQAFMKSRREQLNVSALSPSCGENRCVHHQWLSFSPGRLLTLVHRKTDFFFWIAG